MIWHLTNKMNSKGVNNSSLRIYCIYSQVCFNSTQLYCVELSKITILTNIQLLNGRLLFQNYLTFVKIEKYCLMSKCLFKTWISL